MKFEVPNSTYHLASLKLDDVVEGIAKYYEQPNTDMHYLHYFEKLLAKFDIHSTPQRFTAHVMHTMHSYLPNFCNSFKEYTNEEVVHDMVYDSSGELRHETSCGHGFKLRRKEVARRMRPDVEEYLNTFDCSHDVNFTLFLKEEMRQKGKATRSIAVPQLHLWLIYKKYMGWTYKYFEKNKSAVAYSHIPNESFFTNLFDNFDNDTQDTYSVDFKKQDARMNTLYIQFLEDFILRTTNFPPEHEDKLLWIHSNSFYYKQVIDPYGQIITFSNGEMSGFPGTLVYNSLYSLFVMSITQVIDRMKHPKVTYELNPLAILGDDIIFQNFCINTLTEVTDRKSVV